jgi:hypothetical protein
MSSNKNDSRERSSMSDASKEKTAWTNRHIIGRREVGFRVSVSDALVILCFLLVTVALQACFSTPLLYLPLIVLGHFFLFCNVFRVHRHWELLWGATFIINIFFRLVFEAGVTLSPAFWWRDAMLVQTPLTTIFILIAIFSKDYHGIGCRFVPWGRRIAEHESEITS